MPLLKVNEANLQHCRDVVEQFGQAWIHGDGNIYVDKQAHTTARDFGTPGPRREAGASSYWAYYDDVDEVPDTVAQLKKDFMKNKERMVEQIEEQKVKTDIKVVKQKLPVVETKQSGPDPKEVALAQKEDHLKAREDSLQDWQQKLKADTERQAAKDAELREREAKLQEQLAKLQAQAQPKKEEKPAGK